MQNKFKPINLIIIYPTFAIVFDSEARNPTRKVYDLPIRVAHAAEFCNPTRPTFLKISCNGCT